MFNVFSIFNDLYKVVQYFQFKIVGAWALQALVTLRL